MKTLPVNAETEPLQLRIHGDAALPTLIYLPGLHGDWTLVSSFRAAVSDKVRFVEFTYPRTLDWSLENYAEEIEKALLANSITHGWLLGESFGSQVVWALAARNMVRLSQEHRKSFDKPQRREGCGEQSPENLCVCRVSTVEKAAVCSGLEKTFTNGRPKSTSHFGIDGIVLAGGFVKHPNAPGVALARQLCGSLPPSWGKSGLWLYSRYAKFRHRHAPETLAHMDEFVSRRTELDRRAMKHRLGLIAGNDPRTIARQAVAPVYALSGFWDPIVPHFPVRRWLQKNCPGLKANQIIFRADHNVLGTAPSSAAKIILTWMRQEAG